MRSIGGPWRNNPPEMSPQWVVFVVPAADARPQPWLDLAMKAISSWPTTLRLSALSLAIAAGTTLVAAAVGVTGQLALAARGLHAGLRGQRRLPPLDEPDS
jgi:hypothetical protein